MNQSLHIETKRMIIRSFTPDDAADLYDILGDEITMENCEPAYDFEKNREVFDLLLHRATWRCGGRSQG